MCVVYVYEFTRRNTTINNRIYFKPYSINCKENNFVTITHVPIVPTLNNISQWDTDLITSFILRIFVRLVVVLCIVYKRGRPKIERRDDLMKKKLFDFPYLAR